MATAIRSTTASAFNTTTAPKTVSVSWSAGDYVVVLCMNANNVSTGGGGFPTPTATGLTFTAIDNDTTTTSNHCRGASFQALAGSAGTSVTITQGINETIQYGFVVFVVSGASGLGLHVNVIDTALTASFAARPGATVVGLIGDYSAGATTGAALTPAGGTPGTPGTSAGQYSWYYGSWANVAGSATSYGVSGITSSGGQYTKVLVEFTTPVALDASTPAVVNGISGTSAAVTTAAFSPPANSLLVAFIARDTNASTSNRGTITSTGGLIWARAGDHGTGGSLSGGLAEDGMADVWWAYAASAPGSITVSSFNAASGIGTGQQIFKVCVFTGAESTWAGAIAGSGGTNNQPTVNVVTTRALSLVCAVSCDWSTSGTGTPGSSQTIVDTQTGTGISGHIWRQTSTTATSGTTVTMNMATPASQTWNIVGIEIRPPAAASGGASPNPRPPSRVRVPVMRAANF